MKLSTLNCDEGVEDRPNAGNDEAGSYAFALIVIVLSLMSGAGLSIAYLNENSAQPSVVLAAK
jgi:hypothetical protein